MPKTKNRDDYLMEAAQAHTELCLFATVVNILESGNIKAGSHAAADRVIKICQQHQQVCLSRFDRARAAARE